MNDTVDIRTMFREFPDDARVWIFALESALDSEQTVSVKNKLAAFLSGWKAHGAPVRGSAEVLHQRFILVVADSSSTEVSGCSIDAMQHNVEKAIEGSPAAIADLAEVFYRGQDGVRRVSRTEFKQLKDNRQISADTPVFDNSIQSAADLRGGRWELPLAQSWHNRL